MATSQHESPGLAAGPCMYGSSGGPQGSGAVDDAPQTQPPGINCAPTASAAEHLTSRNGVVEAQPTGSHHEATSSPQGADEPRLSGRGMKSSRLIVDTDLLISEVKKRPSVYDQQEDDYSDRTKKQKCWEEICAVLVPSWEECTQLEKCRKAKEIQTRWRSLKDCFRRELHLQKKESRGGSSPAKRKRYMFYDQLTFLEPMLMRRSTSGKASDTAESPKSEGSDSEPPQSPLPERIPQVSDTPRPKKTKGGAKGLGDFESQIIDMVDCLKKRRDNEADEDYNFVQSLIPYLKKVPEQKKIDLQIDMLRLVKRYVQPASHGARDGIECGQHE